MWRWSFLGALLVLGLLNCAAAQCIPCQKTCCGWMEKTGCYYQGICNVRCMCRGHRLLLATGNSHDGVTTLSRVATRAVVAQLGSPSTAKQLEAVKALESRTDLSAPVKGLGPTEKNIADVVVAGGVPRLVQLLKSRDVRVQATTAAVLANIADQNKAVVIKAGGVPALVMLLGSADAGVQKASTHALFQVAWRSSEGTAAVIKSGGVAPLVRLLTSKDTKVQQAVLYALAAITGSDNPPASSAAVVKAGGVPLLLKLQGSKDKDVQAAAATVLWHMTLGNDAVAKATSAAIIAAGGEPALQRVQSSHMGHVELALKAMKRS